MIRRHNYVQLYELTPCGDDLTMKVTSSLEAENIGDAPEEYGQACQFEEREAPKGAHFKIFYDGEWVSYWRDIAPHPTRKKVVHVGTDKITIAPGKSAQFSMVYEYLVGRDDSDTLSFGVATEGVTIRATAPEDIEVIVDPIHKPDDSGDGWWHFNHRFEVEQHIPVRWFPRD